MFDRRFALWIEVRRYLAGRDEGESFVFASEADHYAQLDRIWDYSLGEARFLARLRNGRLA